MKRYSILIPVALPSSGPEMLRIARLLATPEELHVTALHCRAADESSTDVAASDTDADNPLQAMIGAAAELSVDPILAKSPRIDDGILSTAKKCTADLIMLGWHRPMAHDDQEPGPVRSVLERADCDVAVFLARQFRPVERVLVPFHGGRHDRRALDLAARIARSTDVQVTVLHVVAPDRSESEPGTGWSELVEDISDGRVRLKVVESSDPVDAAVHEAWTGYELILSGASEVWGVDFSFFSESLQRLAFATPASLLVVSAHPHPRSENRSRSRQLANSPTGGHLSN